jgi:hypothetical protein
MAAVELNGRDLMKNITMTVRVNPDWRVALGLLVMRFGAWITGMALEVEDGEQ